MFDICTLSAKAEEDHVGMNQVISTRIADCTVFRLFPFVTTAYLVPWTRT